MKRRKLLLSCFLLCLFWGMLIAPTFADSLKGVPSNQKLTVNGQVVDNIPVYNINGSNYFKLRDIAYYLDYEVEFIQKANAIAIWRGGHGSAEGVSNGKATSTVYGVNSSQKLYVDGNDFSYAVHPVNINGSNYFQLRELAGVSGFGVEFDAASNSIVLDTNYSYSASGFSEAVRNADGWKDLLASSLSKDKENLYERLGIGSSNTPGGNTGDNDSENSDSDSDTDADSKTVRIKAPDHDWWSEQSADVKALTDRDTFNFAVQVIRDRQARQKATQDAIDDGTYLGRIIEDRNIYELFSQDYVYTAVPEKHDDKSNLVKNVLAYMCPKCSIERLANDDLSRINPDKFASVEGFDQKVMVSCSTGKQDVYTIKDFGISQYSYNKLSAFVEQTKNLPDKQRYEAAFQYTIDLLNYEDTVASGALTLCDTPVKTNVNCVGYADTIYTLCRLLDIPVAAIAGNNHAWNIVYVDGQWYFADGTYDDPIGMYLDINNVFSDTVGDKTYKTQAVRDKVAVILAMTEAAGGITPSLY